GRDTGAVRRHRKTEEPELRLTSQRLCPDEGEGVDRHGIDLLLTGQAHAGRRRDAGAQYHGPGQQPGAPERAAPADYTPRLPRPLLPRSPVTGLWLPLSEVLYGELVSVLVLTLTGVVLDLLVSVFLHLLLVLRGVTIPRGREFVVPRPELVPPLLDLLACEAV